MLEKRIAELIKEYFEKNNTKELKIVTDNKRRIKKEDGRGGPGSYKVDTSLLGTRTPSYSFSKVI